MSRLPEQRFGSQWPRSQQAALKAGGERPEADAPASSLSEVGFGFGFRGGPRWMCFPREEKLSFLWRTMVAVAVMLEEENVDSGGRFLVGTAKPLLSTVWRNLLYRN